jgi:uncharacterized lipoprotein YehR (DUF1307 family)
MPASRSFRVKVVGLLCLVALLITVATLLAACGSDPYSGYWKGNVMGEEFNLTIAKDGDAWVVSSPDSKDSEKIKATEEDGKLVLKDPDNPSQTATMERKGDDLVMTLGGVSLTFKKQ